MIIQLNGRSHETADGQSVAGLVDSLGLRPGMVAVEVNEHVVTRDRRETTILAPEDQVEVVTIMGGG
jgi:thiamine biosynthesis protein ThiS